MSETNDKAKFLLVKVSDDLMKVYLTVKPFAQGGVDINVNDVLQILQSKNISYGIKAEVIGTTLDKARLKESAVEDVLIAEGDQTVFGEDGRLEVLFDVAKKTKPQEGAHGKGDFH